MENIKQYYMHVHSHKMDAIVDHSNFFYLNLCLISVTNVGLDMEKNFNLEYSGFIRV